MMAIILEQVSCSTKVEIDGQKAWVNSQWLDGQTVKPRFAGLVQAKLDGRSYWQQDKNNQAQFEGRFAGLLYIT